MTEQQIEAMATRLFDGALRKYRQTAREIGEVEDDRVRSNLAHSHSKLGIFLENALPRDGEAVQVLPHSRDRGGA